MDPSLLRDVVSDLEQQKVSQKRAKRGECPGCGTKLFKIGGFLGKKKEPINVPNMSMDGKCLICEDTSKSAEKKPEAARPRIPGVPVGGPPSGIQPPRVLDFDDDATMVSAITMDIRLHDGNNEHREGEINLNFGALPRKEVAPPPRAAPPSSNGRTPPSPTRKNGGKAPSRLLPLSEDFDMDALLSSRGSKNSSRFLTSSEPSEQVTAPVESPHIDSGKNKEIVFDKGDNHDQKEITFNGDGNRDEDTLSSVQDDDPVLIAKGHDSGSSPLRLDSKPPAVPPPIVEEEEEEMPIPKSLLGDVSLPISRPRESNSTVDQISELLETLRAGSNQVNKLDDIASVIWKYPEPAKKEFFEARGTEMLIEIMWKDIGDSVLQDAAMKVLLAVALSGESPNPKQMLTIESGASVVDALLVCMQMNSMVDSIQRTGCRLLCCFASASSADNEINDGTLQGALHSAINVIEVNSGSPDLKEWAVKTLYYQCVQSSNHDANKRTLVDFSTQGGKSGTQLLVDVLESADDSNAAEEWVTLLLWHLSADSAVARRMSPAVGVMTQLVNILQNACTGNVQACTVQACLATLSNLLKIQLNHEGFDSGECLVVTLEVFRKYGKGKDAIFLNEIGSLIATLAPLPFDKVSIAESGKVADLLFVATTHQDDSRLVAFYLEALVSLSIESKEITSSLNNDANINSILNLCRAENNETYVATALNLLSNIATVTEMKQALIGRIFDTCFYVLERHADSVQIIIGAFAAIRNVCTMNDRDLFSVSLIQKSIVKYMKLHCKSRMIQTHGCFIFLNLGLEVDAAIPALLDVLRNHLDTPDLLMFASYLLWQILEDNEEKKADLLAENGLEVLTTIIVMHHSDTELIEMVSGTLASLSALPKSLGSIEDKQIVLDLVEMMRRNANSSLVLRYAMLFLKNTIVNSPVRVDDVEAAIPLVISGMSRHESDPLLLREASAFLWACTIYSHDCRDKIMALDGLEHTMKILESCSDAALEETTLALFNVLSTDSSC